MVIFNAKVLNPDEYGKWNTDNCYEYNIDVQDNGIKMNEELLSYIWNNKLFNFNNLKVSGSDQDVVIQHTGEPNSDSGPDYFNARIRIGNTTWAGNVELHVDSSHWKAHAHEDDDAYDNVILHVVYNDDMPVYRKNGERIPTLELKERIDDSLLDKYRLFMASDAWIACENQMEFIDKFTVFTWLERLCIERLEEKANAIRKQLERYNQDFLEIFYRQLGRNFGFNTNADAFSLLVQSLPLILVAKHIDHIGQLEALMFGQAGMLNGVYKDHYPRLLKDEYLFLKKKYKLKPVDHKVWKFMRMRPSNFPTVRISQFAHLLHSSSGLLQKILEHNNLSDLYDLFSVESHGYWHDHSDFDRISKPKSTKLGKSSVDILLINTIIPFVFVYGKIYKREDMQEKALGWYEELKPENNHITKKFTELGLAISNAKHSQAVLQLRKKYCDQKKCLSCRFGHQLIAGS